MSDKGDSVAEVEDLGHEHGGGSGSGSGSGSGNIIDDDDSKNIFSAHASDVPPQTGAGSGVRRGLQPPEFLLNMSMEERLELETKLKRKIDLRLMPAIILMYILNYIDRLVVLFSFSRFPSSPALIRIHFPQTRVHPPRGVWRERCGCGAHNLHTPPALHKKREISPLTDRHE